MPRCNQCTCESFLLTLSCYLFGLMSLLSFSCFFSLCTPQLWPLHAVEWRGKIELSLNLLEFLVDVTSQISINSLLNYQTLDVPCQGKNSGQT